MNNNHYLLRDSNEIFGIYTTLDIAYSYLLQFIYNFYRYYKLYAGNSLNISLMLKNYQIIQYENNIVINLYNINNKFKLVDVNSNIINITTISIIDFIAKLENITDDVNINSNDLNLFIPINFTETEKTNFNTNDINIELKELQAKIELLGEMKQNEQNTLCKIKENIKTKEEQVFMEKIKTETIKQKIEQKKEYYEKSKNKFKIDKNIYFKIKEEINSGDREPNNLPELFIEEFKIFSKLEEDDLLNLELSDDIFQEYLKYKPEKIINFITNFDNIFNNDNWANKNNSDKESDNESDSDEEIKNFTKKKLLFTGNI
jgi:hypothetical protein